jgi:hypothetical protein
MAHGTYGNKRAGSSSSKDRMEKLTRRWDRKAKRNKKITKNVDDEGNVSYTKETAGGTQLKTISFDKEGKKDVKRSEYRGLDAAVKKGKIGAIAHKLAGGQDIWDEISHDMGKTGDAGIDRLKERFTGPKESRQFWKGVHKEDRIRKRGGNPGKNIVAQKEMKHGKHKGEIKTVYKNTCRS